MKYDATISGSWSQEVAENRLLDPSARKNGGPNASVPKLWTLGLPL